MGAGPLVPESCQFLVALVQHTDAVKLPAEVHHVSERILNGFFVVLDGRLGAWRRRHLLHIDGRRVGRALSGQLRGPHRRLGLGQVDGGLRHGLELLV